MSNTRFQRLSARTPVGATQREAFANLTRALTCSLASMGFAGCTHAQDIRPNDVAGEVEAREVIGQSLAGALAEAEQSSSRASSATASHSEEFLIDLMTGPCRAERGDTFFGRYEAAFGEVDISTLEPLIDEIVGVDDPYEDVPMGPSLQDRLVRSAAVDTMLSEWYGPRIELLLNNQFDLSSEIAVVARARCMAGLRSADLLQQFLDQEGFPSPGLHGPSVWIASQLAYKHAPPDSPVVDQYADLAELAFESGEITSASYAFLLDGLAHHRGEPLPFGTYIRCVNGEPVVQGEIAEDAEARRAEFGLWPLQQQIDMFRSQCSAH